MGDMVEPHKVLQGTCGVLNLECNSCVQQYRLGTEYMEGKFAGW